MPILSSAVTSAVLTAASRSGQLLEQVEFLTPTQRGAVGHVLGVHDAEGRKYALKMYPADRSHRAAVEAGALNRLAGVLDVPVPVVACSGSVEMPEQVAFVLMSWLPGVRWAQCRPTLTRAQSALLVEQAGALLRRIHDVPGSWFGDLLVPPTARSTPVDSASTRCDEVVQRYLEAGGPAKTAAQLELFVSARLASVDRCRTPVLCHNDFVDGNLFVSTVGAPHISGVFDLERASWGDPLGDLALTRIHIRQHAPDLVTVLLAAYGVHEPHERTRLDVYEAMHLMDEWSWISTDQPHGWRLSIADLDRRLVALISAA